jgi:hypothetical protein
MTHTLGFIGLGMMGLPMAKRLSKAGARFAVFNRTRSKAEVLVTEGAQWCDTPSIVASSSDVVFSMVANPDALREIALGPDGVLAGLNPRRHDHDAWTSPDLCGEVECRSADDARHHRSVTAELADVSDKKNINCSEQFCPEVLSRAHAEGCQPDARRCAGCAGASAGN